MNDDFNPNKLTLKNTHVKQGAKSPPPRHKPGQYFLKGPIPFTWLATAANQSGKSLHVAIALWFLSGIKRNRRIALSGKVLRTLGVKRHSGYNGLNCLEEAGLVYVERHPGRNPIVTLLDYERADGHEQ